ncbi:ATP-grasp fold amidoligase family protein [Vibrio sp. 1865]|uniref:ATP-grasp fold amidoligase family protein n=1 Tax=unclassified Vibrio TaxID=2614977 RepID=UPI002964A6D4|nr:MULTISPECIES: ATP-grasp fold amidoligase family protein [unclassified Vibrio]MDW2092047.1 ATP-grasp fold amidoligase family protein [Vibrio sp. 1866]MDW3102126.1 ATP-grasp fold amidoligase family protein [Vibrio sp. 1874]MDW3199806.1 ATP-grasp fold amidoligase family protein [Vibrio sp. 1865]
MIINSDSIFSFLASAIKRKTLPNIVNPSSLTDKVLKIKMSPDHPKANLRALVSDRKAVREYIDSKSTECKLIPLLWSGSRFSLEDYENLPNKFVIKANHGSKMVRIVDKSDARDNYESVSAEVNSWQFVDYYKKGKEWVYKSIERTLIVEKFIDFKDGVPPDYKFFCLNGKVSFIQVDLDRFNGHCRNLYNREFLRLPVCYQFPSGYDIEKPILFDQALRIAEKLSSDFDFIRVDLYILDDGIYFGELTNFPGNCLESFNPKSFDFEIGRMLTLEE